MTYTFSLINYNVPIPKKGTIWKDEYVYEYSKYFIGYVYSKYNVKGSKSKFVYIDQSNIIYRNHYNDQKNVVFGCNTTGDKMVKCINKISRQIKQLINAKSYRFIIIPVIFECSLMLYTKEEKFFNHTTALIFDTKLNMLEWFDPAGLALSTTLYDYVHYHIFQDFKKQIEILIDKIIGNKKFNIVTPFDIYAPFNQGLLYAFYVMEKNICCQKLFKVFPSMSFSTIWVYWYIEMRLLYPNIHPYSLINKITDLLYKDIETIKRSETIASKFNQKIIKKLPICNIIRNYALVILNLKPK